MKLLIDTHCWLWMQSAPERFSQPTLALLLDSENQLFFSAASAWEIAIKHALGKLRLPTAPHRYVPGRMAQSGTQPLPIEQGHALRVATLPPHHRDPFDRLLIAQAQLEKLALVTADKQLRDYDVRLIWA